MSRRRLFTFLLPIAATLALAGGAWAYFNSTGSGSGSGTVSTTTQPVTIAAATGNTQFLLPTGAPTGDVDATITNPNSSSVHIGSLSLDTTQGTNGFSSNASSCALTFTTQTNGGSGWTIPASGQLTVDMTSALTMGTSAASSCQGQTFSAYLKTP